MRRARAVLLSAALVAGCTGTRRPDPVDAAQAGAVSLLALPFAELSIPEHNRPDGRPPPERIKIEGPWRLIMAAGGRQAYETPLPIRTRTLFFFSPPPGMRVERDDGVEVPHKRDATDDTVRWSFTATAFELAAPLDHEKATAHAYWLSYPLATAREAALNHAFSGIDDPAVFVRATIQDGPESRTGLLLPAPGRAVWDLTVPPAAELSFAPGLVKPEIRDAGPSDGATATWEVRHGDRSTVVWRAKLTDDGFGAERVDLSGWAGQDVRLVLTTDPGDNEVFDYAFFGEPTIASRLRHPKRVVVVFVDTLRPDHLGAYGYGRDTSPALDALAAGGVVFEEARSVAPWTLPTARTLTTGRHPELYGSAATLQGALRDQGWATAMFAGNLYLSSNFGINRDWGLHWVENSPPASAQVDRALKWLEQQDGRDAMLMVHFMDVHLPYREPVDYRTMFTTSEPPATLGQVFHRTSVLKARMDDDAKQYLQDRYDSSIRYVDDEVSRLLRVLGPDDVVVYLSDHGEEFWEHGGFEHGHTLYDEVLRVPLVIRAPGVSPARVGAPVSLIDLAPTLAELLDVDLGHTDGSSLVPAMGGDEAALRALSERGIGFGRPLYGDARWGALQGGDKYTTYRGREYLFDLAEDPSEMRNLLVGDTAAAPYRDRLAAALDTDVQLAIRLAPNAVAVSPRSDLVAELVVPGGVKTAWVGDDPTLKSEATVAFDGDRVTVTWLHGYRGAREVFVVPAAPFDQAILGLSAALHYDDQAFTDVFGEIELRKASGGTMTRWAIGGRTIDVDRAIAPLPWPNATAIEGYDPELASMLRAVGYAVGDDEEDTSDE